MGKKKKGAKNKKGGKNTKKNNGGQVPGDDDGWGALDEFTNEPTAPATETKVEPPKTVEPVTSADDAALAFLNGGAKPVSEPATETVAKSNEADTADAAALAFLGGAPATSEGSKKKKKKKKKTNKSEAKTSENSKTNAMVARIKAQREQKRKEEEELAAIEAEELRKEQEEADALAAAAAAKQAKKDAKKARRAQMKADGLIKSKTERKREAAAAAARKQMIASGMIELPTDDASRKNKKKDVPKKKKGGLNKMQRKEKERQEAIAAAEARAERLKAEADAKKAVEEESSGGDWEDESGEDESGGAIVLDDLKEFSDDDSDEELNEARRRNRIQANLKKQAEANMLEKQENVSNKISNLEDGSDSGGDWEDESDDGEETKINEAKQAREKREKELKKQRSADDLRSPILCVLGHVDTGKTKLLDKIRRTNVQDGEAGGITQQIGATYFPMDNIRKKTQALNKDFNLEYRLPGLLVIDTPGHESFTNLRSRGSGLCDIAILVIDIMHGLEPQTIESINLLRSRKTPFIVALNKVDRLFGWKVCKDSPIRHSLSQQKPDVVQEFETRTREVLTQLAEQSLNAKLYYENDDFRRNVSVVPTSAITGEGVPDILLLTVQITQDLMTNKLMYSGAFECSLLEVKVIPGLGTTIDVVLKNGVLHDNDTLVLCGIHGPIVTPIRALLTPKAMKELRIKSDYDRHKTIKAAMGIKISAQNLDGAIAGTNVMVYRKKDGDDLDEMKRTVMEDYDKVMNNISTQDRGVYVQASTLGALEALLEFLKSEDVKIPVCGVSIGPVHKKDVMKASVMLEHKPEWAVILAFDVKVTADARQHAENMGVKIFTADIIYHLQESFTRYTEEQKRLRKENAEQVAIFPCQLKILRAFREKNPVILGVEVLEGYLKVGTPICVPEIKDEDGEPLMIGKFN
jgi:translation initiation factor 5B